MNANEIFLFRFGIIHCVADSGVFGLRVELPQQQRQKKPVAPRGRDDPIEVLSNPSNGTCRWW